MYLLSKMVAVAKEEFRKGFDGKCGCDLPNHEEVLLALWAVQPARVDKVTRALGVPWQHRGTIARRLDDLRRAGRAARRGHEFRVAGT